MSKRGFYLLFFLMLAVVNSNAQKIVFHTQRNIGEKITLTLRFDKEIRIEGVKEDRHTSGQATTYTLSSQEVTISGDVLSFRSSNNEIDLMHFEACPLLEEIDCSQNKLTTLCVAQLKELKKLSCYANQLESIDLTDTPNLESLFCSNNAISQIDIGQHTKLKELSCSSNKITSLTLSQFPALETLKCYKNAIERLDLARCRSLSKLWCSENKLSLLDISNNKELRVVWCYDNSIEKIIFGTHPKLQWLCCENNRLSSLDAASLSNLELLKIYCNNIRGKSMDNIMELLPAKGAKNGDLMVVDTRNKNERNICTAKQVAVAKQKGWNVLNYANGENDHQGIDYHGAGESHTHKTSQHPYSIAVIGQSIALENLPENCLVTLWSSSGKQIKALRAVSGYVLFEEIGQQEAFLLLSINKDQFIKVII